LKKIIDGLKVDEKRMEENIYMTGGLVFSERVLLKLIEHNMSREDAYVMVQKASMKVWNKERQSLKEAMKEYVNFDLDDAFDVSPYLKNVDKIFERFESKR